MRPPWACPPKPVPQELLELIEGLKAVPPAPGAEDLIPEGERNDFLFRRACALRRSGLNEVEIEATLIAINYRCVPPLPDEEVTRIAASASKYEPGPGTGSAETNQQRKFFRQEPEPWSSEVAGAGVLDDIVGVIRRFIIIGNEEIDAIALWILHSFMSFFETPN